MTAGFVPADWVGSAPCTTRIAYELLTDSKRRSEGLAGRRPEAGGLDPEVVSKRDRRKKEQQEWESSCHKKTESGPLATLRVKRLVL